MSAWQRNAAEAVKPFCEAEGDVEFRTDGTSVNTMQGWREMKVGLFAKRKRASADESAVLIASPACAV